MNLRTVTFVLLFCLLAVLSASGSCCFAAQAKTFTPTPAQRTETLSAYTRAITKVQISSEVQGRVEHVFADVGQSIPEDGVFAGIDDTFVRLDLQEQLAQREQIISRRNYYDTETRRYRDLVAGNHADQSTLDKLEQQLEESQLKLKALDVAIARLEERLQRHKVRAPSGFTVMQREVEPGEWVTAGQHLATLGDYRTLAVPFALDPVQFRWLTAHADALTLRLQGLHGHAAHTLRARLHEVAPGFDEKTRKINLELAITPPADEARGGLRAELDMQLPERSGSVLVPASALTTRYEQHWLTRPDGSRLHVVLLGAEANGMLRVQAEGLDASQHFLLAPGPASGSAPDSSAEPPSKEAAS